MSTLQPLYGMTLARLDALAAAEGLPRYAGRQMARWLYRRHVQTLDAMTDLPAAVRLRLSARCQIGRIAPCRTDVSADGTKKYLYPTRQGAFVESAYIPDGERATLCVSSQAGCRMGCRFCATGQQGLHHSLGADEILNQVGSLPERERLTNLVFMGMGEPLDNTDNVLDALEILTADWGFGWSPTRITVSTAGVGRDLERLLRQTQVHLAVSLHNPFPQERAAIMPIERTWPLHGLIARLRSHDFAHQRRLSFEYILLAGLNDTPRHLRELSRLLGGLHCRINLIRFHKIPGSPFFSPPEQEIVRFRDALTRKGIQTTIRASRGEDIRAACGLLSTVRTNLE